MAIFFNTGPGFKTRQQIAAEYSVNVKTLVDKVRKVGIELPPGILPPKIQKQVYEALGYPPSVRKQDYELV